MPVTAETFTEAADRILETLILELTDVEASSILQYDAKENTLRLTTAKGQADVLCIVEGRYNRDLSFKPGEGIAGRVFETGNPIYWDRHSPEAERLKRSPNLATPRVPGLSAPDPVQSQNRSAQHLLSARSSPLTRRESGP